MLGSTPRTRYSSPIIYIHEYNAYLDENYAIGIFRFEPIEVFWLKLCKEWEWEFDCVVYGRDGIWNGHTLKRPLRSTCASFRSHCIFLFRAGRLVSTW